MLSVTNSATTNLWQTEAASTESVNASPLCQPIRSTQLDGACALLALMVQARAATQANSTGDVEADFKKLDELKKQLADAIQHAKDAADSGGFFGFLGDVFGSDIAQVAGAVAAVAAIVATGGAAGPIILLAVAEAMQIAAEVGPKLGLDPKICMGLAICSAALGFCTGAGSTTAVSTVAESARYVEVGARVTQSAATVTGGVMHGVAGHYQAQQLRYQSDAVEYRAQDDATNMDLDDAFAALEKSLRGEHREARIVSDIVANDTDTNVSLSQRI